MCLVGYGTLYRYYTFLITAGMQLLSSSRVEWGWDVGIIDRRDIMYLHKDKTKVFKYVDVYVYFPFGKYDGEEHAAACYTSPRIGQTGRVDDPEEFASVLMARNRSA